MQIAGYIDLWEADSNFHRISRLRSAFFKRPPTYAFVKERNAAALCVF